jgi:hypothetical protein
MAVMMPRERWSDERLDEAFGRIDGDVRELRVEMKKGFERIDERFDQIDKRFEKVDGKFESMQSEMNLRFDAVQRNMTTWAIALFSAMVTLNAAVIAAVSLT